jgi:hypothetical protein
MRPSNVLPDLPEDVLEVIGQPKSKCNFGARLFTMVRIMQPQLQEVKLPSHRVADQVRSF